MAVWSDVAQRALRDVAELSARTTQESVRQYTECQQMNMDLLREAQAAMEHASEDATRSLGETFREASSRMQDVYARSDRLRAA